MPFPHTGDRLDDGNKFLEAFVKRCNRDPDGIFATVIMDEGASSSWSWGALLARSAVFAGLYRSRDVARGDIVFVILKHGPDLYPAFIGAMLIGAIPSFLPFPTPKQDPLLYWENHRAVFVRTGARLVVTYRQLAAQVEAALLGTATYLVFSDDAGEASQDLDFDIPEFSDIAFLQHSSGTTGLKKGVMLNYRAVVGQIEAYARTIRLDSDLEPVIASWLPLYHDMGLITSFMMPLYLGIRLVSIDAFAWTNQPRILFDAIQRFRATHVWLPNFAFNHLVRAVPKSSHYDLASARFINCSEPCKAETFDKFLTRFSTQGVRGESLQTCYAMAETVFAVSQSLIDRPAERIVADQITAAATGSIIAPLPGAKAIEYLSSGSPISGLRVKIMKDSCEVGEGQIGEIHIAGSFLFSGYFKDLEATSAAMNGEWFATGDLGFLKNSQIYVTGRTKDLIIVNGRNFFAHDLEAGVYAVEGIKPGRAIVFGIYSAIVGSEQIIVVAEAEGQDRNQLSERINHSLVDYFGLTAADIQIVEPGWLIKTTSGKISRSENTKKYLEMRSSFLTIQR